MSRPAVLALATGALLLLSILPPSVRAQDPPATKPPAKPLKALLVAGGCCHDYAGQTKVLSKGISERAFVQVDVYWTDDKGTAPVFPLYEKPDWAKGYDVIIHDECASSINDKALIQRILDTHQTIPAVNLHCGMHSFRTGTDMWFDFLGVQSSGHGPQEPIRIEFVDKDHPITKPLDNWQTIKEELYNNVKLHGGHPLAIGKQTYKKNGQEVTDEYVVAWTNEKQGARSFSTTIGHNTDTVADPKYLDLVTRGLLWSCGKLTPEYFVPFTGENKVTFIPSKGQAQAPAAAPPVLGTMPKNATLVKLSASSSEGHNPMIGAVDGNPQTRWCAAGGDYPQWLQLELPKPHKLDAITLQWESNNPYEYRVEGSADGNAWTLLLDATKNTQPGIHEDKLITAAPVKFVRITGTGMKHGGWCSIREIALKGDGIQSLWPAGADGKPFEAKPTLADPYSKEGNVPPKAEKLTPEKEAAILKDVTVPDGFDVTVFAAPPMVNYPVFVAAAPDGTLFVSSDGNGSLGRSPKRGRVIRLKDTDGDGRADETNVFCEIDAPRGLVWDHDRLYLMHPPHLSVFIDKDGDGKSDEQKVLVKDLAFGYADRPADHTTNGMSLGVDGWLYIAGGDFGFLNAEGTDGRKVQHRGGGVLRVRPDGTGLEIYSTGTRNILEVAISPAMDLFARDNTNDGGGWDVRLHHFTGGDDHGYPRLYKNFNDECVQPLADYGGGSGCGAVYIDEPGFGKWNNAPFTADWGTGSLYRHTVEPKGSTFAETAKPESFIRMTRPTDADVDALSRVYCASWKGATFNWEGPDVGYIVCVKPKGFRAEPLPDFAKATGDELVRQFESPSYRRRVEAQRELVRRGDKRSDELLARGLRQQNDARAVAGKLTGSASDADVIANLGADDPVIRHIAIREAARRRLLKGCFDSLASSGPQRDGALRALAMMHEPEVVTGLMARLEQERNAASRLGLLSALCRLHYHEGTWKGDSWGTRPDTRGPYYQPEAWSETPRIAAVLKETLQTASPEEAGHLVREMNRNRIQSNEALEQIIALAKSNPKLVSDAVLQMAAVDSVPPAGIPLVLDAARSKDASPATLAGAVAILAKSNEPAAVPALLSALATLDEAKGSGKDQEAARSAFLAATVIENQHAAVEEAAEKAEGRAADWANAALLTLAARNNGSPEARDAAQKAIRAAWATPARRIQLIKAAARIRSHAIDDEILFAERDEDKAVAEAARRAIGDLKLSRRAPDTSPRIGSLPPDQVIAQVVPRKGDPGLGELLFTKANCIACHTTSKDQAQKGPFLGSIAKTYKRPDLATAILIPSKTIAQGFTTNVIVLTDGRVVTGFVTNEESDRVTLRDAQAKEYVISKADIEERGTQPVSMMPEGVMKNYTLHELASLLDYLEALSVK